LQADLDDRERGGRVDAHDERTITELRRLRWLVDHASSSRTCPTTQLWSS
jgi:hypothetical protein